MFKSYSNLSRLIIGLCLKFLLAASVAATESALTISYRSPIYNVDTQYYSYYSDLLKLALEKTRPQYGDYSLKAAPPVFSALRALAHASDEIAPNLAIETGYEDELVTHKALTYADIPIDGGIFGYRVCFTNTMMKEKLKTVKSLEDLRPYSIGQGIGWTDGKILRANGLNVVELGNFDSLPKMLNAGRINLFCRGINQIKSETAEFSVFSNITLEESFVLVYPLPRYFYFNAKNTQARDRIKAGLEIAFNDGSLKNLWLKHYLPSIQLVNLPKRNFIHLKNPLLENLSPGFETYFIDPLSEK